MRGKIYEQKGQEEKAKEHYEKFLYLQKDKDPCIAWVEDTKKRLIKRKIKYFSKYKKIRRNNAEEGTRTAGFFLTPLISAKYNLSRWKKKILSFLLV